MPTEHHARAGDALIQNIMALAPPGAPLPTPLLTELTEATQALIRAYQAEGKLDENPAALAMNRSVDLHRELAQTRLQGRRVLVTGGAGCVATRLIPLLASLGALEIAIVDMADEKSPASAGAGALEAGSNPARANPSALVPSYHQVDIRDARALEAVFVAVRPHTVFHLASVREPGRAEAVVREAIETNVFGTRNVIEACLRHGVDDAIYSSTGKCFAYISDHVYTGSKKLAEAQWVVAAQGSSSTRFRCTRFTHVMENGVIAQDIEDGIASGLVGLHGPDRHFNIQNLRQATHLLVNALALSAQTVADGFWSAVDLGWPVNSLELALYRIHASGKPAAVRFLGVPKGYDETFFRGQFCWSEGNEYHPLINAIEADSSFTDSTGTMIGARVPAFDAAALARALASLEAALANDALDVAEVKHALVVAVAALAKAMFAAADLTRLIDVLWWGAAPAWAGPAQSEAVRFKSVIALLADTVASRLAQSAGPLPADVRHKLLAVSQTLAQIGLGHCADVFKHHGAAPLAPAAQALAATGPDASVGNSVALDAANARTLHPPAQLAPQALLFDLGGVVIDIDFERAFAAWQPLSALSPEGIRSAFCMDAPYQRHERGEIDAAAFYDHLAERLHMPKGHPGIALGWNSIFVGEIAPTCAALRQLRGRMPCYAFTNTNAAHAAVWMALYPGVAGLFDKVFMSHEMGLRKPEKNAFDAIASQIGVPAGEVLFFDDTLENVQGALAAGLQAVHVTSPHDVLAALEAAGCMPDGGDGPACQLFAQRTAGVSVPVLQT